MLWMLFAIVTVFILVWPLLCIWSLNTLFGLGIAYSVSTWCAALILSMAVYGSTAKATKN